MKTTLRITVDHDKCVGSRICVAVAPRVFQLNEAGQAQVVDALGEEATVIRMAEEACPVSAITVEKADT